MHFITAIGYDDNGYIYANDPNKSSHPRKQHQDKFKSCLKQAFIFWPEVREPEPEPQKNTEEIIDKVLSENKTTSTGTKIIDISRYNKTINWDKAAPELALVIIKASGLYSNGADTQYANNVKGAVSHGIPFHVYHYLYSKTEAEAKRDAGLFYKTVADQKLMPLCWVLDCESGWGIEDSKAVNIAGIFEEELRRLAGKNIRVGIYIANNKYKTWKFDYDHFDYVWIPKYGKNDGTIAGSSKPAYKCDLWQYTSHGEISGIDHDVDLNVIMEDGKGLDWLIRKN